MIQMTSWTTVIISSISIMHVVMVIIVVIMIIVIISIIINMIMTTGSLPDLLVCARALRSMALGRGADGNPPDFVHSQRLAYPHRGAPPAAPPGRGRASSRTAATTSPSWRPPSKQAHT